MSESSPIAAFTTKPWIPASESYSTEFKSWISLPRAKAKGLTYQSQASTRAMREGIFDVVKACAAMHNNDGGEIFFGVADDGKPTGDRNRTFSESRYNLDKVVGPLLRHYLAPMPFPRSEIRDVGGKVVLRIEIDPGVTIPAALVREIRGGKTRYGCGTVFVRTLQSRQFSSSRLEKSEEWVLLMNRCIRSRGSDVIGPAFMEVGTLINRCDPNNLEDKNSERGKDGINHTEYQIRCIADALAHLDFNEVREELRAVANQLTECRRIWIGSRPTADATNEIKVGWVCAFKEIVVRHRGSRFTSKQ